MYTELERIGKKLTMTYIKVLFWNLPEKTEPLPR